MVYANRAKWAHRHGYVYCQTAKATSAPSGQCAKGQAPSASWSKLLLVAALQDACEVVWLLDADVAITDERVNLDRLISNFQQHPATHLMITPTLTLCDSLVDNSSSEISVPSERFQQCLWKAVYWMPLEIENGISQPPWGSNFGFVNTGTSVVCSYVRPSERCTPCKEYCKTD